MSNETFLLRKKSLGKSSVGGIIHYSKRGIKGFRSDGTEQLLTGVMGDKGPKSKYVPANLPDAGVCIRWGCTASVPSGLKIINKSEAIHRVANKAAFRKITADLGLAPKTWLSWDEFVDDEDAVLFLEQDWDLSKPMVVRPATHAQGKNLSVCYTPEEVEAACLKYGQYYISELINKKKEFRVFIHAGRVVWVAEKKPGNPDQVAWNVAQGGMFTNVKWGEWDMAVIQNALLSYHQSGLDFGGVDVMVDADGKAYTLEINSAPSQTSGYRQECVARAFDYHIDHGWDHFDKPEGPLSWQKVIHQGVWKPVEG